LQIQDLIVSNRLAADWDTLGWVHFRLGNLDKAEKYLKAAWTVTQDTIIGEHLGQVYEKLGKRQQAARAYRLAKKDAGAELSDERTYKLPQIRDWGGGYKSAEFVIALTKEPGVADTKFLSGAQELRSASAALGALESGFPFPDDSHARVVRRGVLSCSWVSKGCVFVFYPANAIAQPSVGIPLDQQ
jgi:hypothetical protein